ncbi:LLM class flavin-dependent oxidoreductase [Nonomuraea sp. PA05]|uniref:LLM class flavin-dependent oxidoreductase n=1 Tax=Nonomuraea sp. PA05 TaxID=2604466 RepID=UPI0011D6BF6D|nr:LLM class flavin-dependent oxidoreductase [Nonomuraea sp. PA05]TYB52398.1 LLM class flavin-dependent oxidoreductase [Nonomuraea sp. PA05]
MSEARRVRVGIVLPRPAGDPGEWLTEAVAFEAAGADALWVEHGAAPELDPLTLTAALAAVTYRALLVVAVAPDDGRSHALATVERLSRGRLALIGEVSGMRTVVRLEDGGYGEGEGRWASVGVPVGRAAWREALREAEERGDHGVLVPADPRLLDLLRNPEDPGGRHDLQLAQG